jgi:hypothetical protein
MTRRILSALCAATLLLSVGATAVFAGEITGNGKSLHIGPHQLHGRSSCAFSGQEDLQWFNPDGSPKATFTRGDPGHAQSWGQIPKTAPAGQVSRDFLTSIGSNPGIACNPTRATGPA